MKIDGHDLRHFEVTVNGLAFHGAVCGKCFQQTRAFIGTCLLLSGLPECVPLSFQDSMPAMPAMPKEGGDPLTRGKVRDIADRLFAAQMNATREAQKRALTTACTALDTLDAVMARDGEPRDD